MALRLKDLILRDVQALIRSLTGFEENQENFKACERFILSNLLYHRYLSVDRHALRRSMEGMVVKFHIHGFSNRGEELDTLVKEFLACSDFKDLETPDLKWCLLSLLLHLGQNPTSFLGNLENASQSYVSIVSDDDPMFDWASYLNEGSEDFFQDWDAKSSDEDEVDRMEVQSKSVNAEAQSTTKNFRTACSDLGKSQKAVSTLSEKANLNQPHVLNAQCILTAECWLRNNIQHDWWTKAFFNDKSLSNHPFSQSALLCNPASKSGIKTSTLSEHKVVQEIIWLLSAPCDSAVFMRVISDDGLGSHYCVRPHVTVPSLTEDVFASFIESICSYADMVEELQTFSATLHEGIEQKKVCSTYEAYRCGIQYELKFVLDALSQLEQRAHQQSDTLTLTILREELSPCLSMIELLHKLHRSAVLDWKLNPNWLCASHLLSVLLSSLRNADENNSTNFRIFVQTFQVYIKIIDQWLTGGQLYDAQDEFFITRIEKENSSLGASFEKRDWENKIRAIGVEPPRALQVLTDCLLKAAQPLHVLCELNRLPELWKHTSSRCSLKTLFLQNLISYLKVSQNAFLTKREKGSKEEDNTWWKKLDHPVSEGKSAEKSHNLDQCISADDVKSVMSHLYRLEDTFLVKHFQALFIHSLDSSGCDSPKERAESPLLNELLVLSRSISDHLPLESCVERAVLCLSADWEGIAGGLVADILIQERQLLHHMHTAQCVFLLQTSHKLHPFLSHFFKLILHRGNSMWMNSHTLSVLLQDCLDSDQFTFLVNVGNISTEINALDCIDCVNIKYQVEWPLCAIIGEKSQRFYNMILRVLLKVRWGLWLLEDLNLAELNTADNSELSRRLLHLRFWLLHVVRGTYNFLAGHILNGMWVKLEEDMKCAKDMHSIIKVHGRFLDCAVQRSLYANQSDPIKNAIFQLVVLAENLHSLWNCDLSKVSLNKLSNIESCYSQCHRFLAASLHSLAEEEGLQHLVVLSNLFNWNLPAETAL